jgi:hypothetical protein
LIDLEEKNILPTGYDSKDYETKDFTSPKLVQDFPLRGRGVFLRIRCRRWRHKVTKAVIHRDNFLVADGSKFTLELSAFLKDTGGYASRYHEQYSQLLPC